MTPRPITHSLRRAVYALSALTSHARFPFPRVNCPFYHKMGACRHGEACDRKHNKPLMSQTVSLAHMYANPMAVLHASTSGNVRLTAEQESIIQKDVRRDGEGGGALAGHGVAF